jgi:YggT family protein
MNVLSIVVDWIVRIILFVVLVDVVLSYFMDPYHPARRTLDRMVEPLLAPIRKIMPKTSQVDFSPIVLMLALVILNQLIQAIFRMVQ